MKTKLQRREFGIDPKDPILCQWMGAIALASIVAAVGIILVPAYWLGRALSKR